MRITDQMMFQASVVAADRASQAEATAQSQVSTGLQFIEPGDAPGTAGQAVIAQTTVERYTAIGADLSSATASLQTAGGALTSISNELSKAQEVAEQLADSTYTAADRAAGAAQIGGIISTIVGQLNTQQGSQYLFGGTANTAPPFDSSGNFHGNTQSISIEVAPGVEQDVSVNVAGVMSGTGGGANVLGALQSLQTALNANSTTGIQAALDPLQTGIGALADAQATLGSTQSVLNAATTANSSALATAQTQASSLTSADVIDASSNLASTQQALQAALDAASTSFQFNLLSQMK
jgi:flagellar hook-associated protein 3 FlgL